MKHIFIILLYCLLGLSIDAASYYVATNGNNSADGSIGTPWLTIDKATSTMVAGDTAYVLPGTYGEDFTFDNNGTPASPISVIGSNLVNTWSVLSRKSNCVVNGINFVSDTNTGGQYAVKLYTNANSFSLLNCTIKDLRTNSIGIMMFAKTSGYSDSANNCTFSNIVFDNTTHKQCLMLKGVSNLVTGCTWTNLHSADVMYITGHGHTISNNLVIDQVVEAGEPNHPDTWQYVGPEDGYDIRICNNRYFNIGGQICQMETYAGYTTNWLIYNNIFSNVYSSAMIDVPGVKFFNNTFYHTGMGKICPLTFYFYTAHAKGAATNGFVVNNVFIDCNPSLAGGVTNSWYGCYPQEQWTNTYGMTNGVTNGYWFTADYNYVMYTNNTSVSVTNWTGSNRAWYEVHGINGGDPGVSLSDFTLEADSLLIGKGLALNEYFTTDFRGITRGSTWDMGAYQYTTTTDTSTNLLLRLSFEDSFTSQGYVTDQSGYGNHGYRFNSTNWITATNGVLGGTAAMFTTNAVMTDDPDCPNGQIPDGYEFDYVNHHYYPASQYIAVTNNSSVYRLTNCTISLWARFIHNTQGKIFILDSAYNPNLVGKENHTNCWRFARAPLASYCSFRIYSGTTTDSDADQVVRWPVDSINGTTDIGTTGFHLYTVTVSCETNSAVAYYDGSPYQTNTVGIPWLRMLGTPNPWLCIGAAGHNGTYTWGDDRYPNDAYMHGALDDIRIYNRILSATEVGQLYAGTLDDDNPDPEPSIISHPPQRVGGWQ